jgi:hypothetical protein
MNDSSAETAEQDDNEQKRNVRTQELESDSVRTSVRERCAQVATRLDSVAVSDGLEFPINPVNS